MKISAVLVTSDFRGDHSADVRIALDVTGDTTLKELIENKVKAMNAMVDYIELRIIQEDSDED